MEPEPATKHHGELGLVTNSIPPPQLRQPHVVPTNEIRLGEARHRGGGAREGRLGVGLGGARPRRERLHGLRVTS